MTAIHVDSPLSDDGRRAALYDGDIFLYTPRPSTLELIAFAAGLAAAAFAPLDPQTAQFDMAVEDYAALLAELKPRFIHHPEAKRLIRAMLADFGCDLELTYFDVPRLRSSTSDDYLTTGIAFAFHPHRDTWYSAPTCQLNWWLPVFPITVENGLAFHPRYWTTPVKNGSSTYNYAEWNATSRHIAASQIGTDTRVQPRPEEPVELEPQYRPLVDAGGLILFSGAQLHSSVPNTSGRTRFSIDLRTVHLDDVRSHRGAANVDSACTGTTMGDYLRATDLAHVDADLIAAYDTPPVGSRR